MFHLRIRKRTIPPGRAAACAWSPVRSTRALLRFLPSVSPWLSPCVFASTPLQNDRSQGPGTRSGRYGILARGCGSAGCLALFAASSTLNQLNPNTALAHHPSLPHPRLRPVSPSANDAVLSRQPRSRWTRRRRRRLRTTFSLSQIKFWPTDSSLLKRCV